MSFEVALSRFAVGLKARKTRRDRPLSERTFTERFQTIQRLHRELGDLLAPDDVLVPRLRTWREGRRKAYKSEQLSESAVRSDVFTLRLFYEILKRKPNPAAELDMGPRPQRHPRPMEREHVDLLFVQLDPGPEQDLQRMHDRALCACLLNGLRRVEVCRLHTRSARYEASEKALVFAVHGKGDRFDDLPFGPVTSAWVAEYLLRTYEPDLADKWIQELGMLLAFDRLARKALPEEPMFIDPSGGRLTVRSLNRRFAHYRTLADLPPQEIAPGKWKLYGPHSLRHTFCTELLEAGEDSRIVQRLARHASITTTEGYLKVRRGPMARAVRQMYTPGKVAYAGS